MKPVILFDLDGTLSNPRTGITGCIRHALEVLDQPQPGDSELDAWIGPPLRQSFADHLGSGALADEALACYRERFAAIGMYENELYSGVVAALDEIAPRAERLFVITSKPHVYAVPIIRHFSLERFFTAVHGSELDGRLADKSELIGHVLAAESIPAERAVMVGDRRHDIEGAAANGVASVAALWGFGSREELAAAGATRFCATIAELPGVLFDA